MTTRRIAWRTPAVLVAALLASWQPTGVHATGTAPPAAVVEALVAAFNAQSAASMMAFVTDDVEWYSIDGSSLGTEALGRETLRASMREYFAACPTCRSALEWVRESPQRVVALERAMWTAASGAPRAQVSVSVYEFRDGRISRVYYFPAEKAAAPEKR